MGTPCSARGSMKDASTPVCEKGKGPCSLKQVHGPSHFALAGTWSMEQTMESSSALCVTDTKEAFGTSSGMEASGGRRQIAKRPDSCRNLRGMGGMVTSRLNPAA